MFLMLAGRSNILSQTKLIPRLSCRFYSQTVDSECQDASPLLTAHCTCSYTTLLYMGYLMLSALA